MSAPVSDLVARLRQDELMRLLGARDGLSHALIWVRDQIAGIDGRYSPRIHPLHTRKRKHRDDTLRPLKALERRIADSLKDCQDAYARSSEGGNKP